MTEEKESEPTDTGTMALAREARAAWLQAEVSPLAQEVTQQVRAQIDRLDEQTRLAAQSMEQAATAASSQSQDAAERISASAAQIEDAASRTASEAQATRAALEDWIGREWEPVAQSLASLADETRETIWQTHQAAADQADEWSRQQEKARKDWNQTVRTLRSVAQEATDAARQAQDATQDLEVARSRDRWWTVAIVLLTTMGITSGLVIASWLLLPFEVVTGQEGTLWLRLR